MDKLKIIESMDIAKVDYYDFKEKIETIMYNICQNEEDAECILKVHPKYGNFGSMYDHSRHFQYGSTNATLEDYYALCRASKLQMPEIPEFAMKDDIAREEDVTLYSVKDLLETVYSICRSKKFRISIENYDEDKAKCEHQIYFLLKTFLEGSEEILLSPELYGYLINFHETDPPFSYTIRKGKTIPKNEKGNYDAQQAVAKWKRENLDKAKNVEWIDVKPKFPQRYRDSNAYNGYVGKLVDILGEIAPRFENRKRHTKTDKAICLHMINGSLYSKYEHYNSGLTYDDISRIADTHSILRAKNMNESYNFYGDITEQVVSGEQEYRKTFGIAYDKDKEQKVIENCKKENFKNLKFCRHLYYRYLLSVIANFLVHKIKDCKGSIDKYKCEIRTFLKIAHYLVEAVDEKAKEEENTKKGEFAVAYSKKNINFNKLIGYKELAEVNKKEKDNTTNYDTRFGV